jgi:hypothetical protein
MDGIPESIGKSERIRVSNLRVSSSLDRTGRIVFSGSVPKIVQKWLCLRRQYLWNDLVIMLFGE